MIKKIAKTFHIGDKVVLTDSGIAQMPTSRNRKEMKAMCGILTISSLIPIPIDGYKNVMDVSFLEIPYGVCSLDIEIVKI